MSDDSNDLVLQALARIEARLSNLEAKIEPIENLLAQGPGAAATAIDAFDDFAEKLGDLDQRFERVTALAEIATRPEILSRLTEAFELLDSAPALIATAMDTLDAKAAAFGDWSERLNLLSANAELLTRPDNQKQLLALLENANMVMPMVATMIDALDAQMSDLAAQGVEFDRLFGTVKELVPSLLRLLQNPDVANFVNNGLIEKLAGTVQSAIHAAPDKVTNDPIGFFGLLRILKDPDVQVALTAGISIVKGAGAAMKAQPQLDARNTRSLAN